MGILDEAIREHLELKRRRGADPNEVERLEQEALGPVRRGPTVTDEPFPEEGPFELEDGAIEDEGGPIEHEGGPIEHEEGPFEDERDFDHEEVLERDERTTILYDDEADRTHAEPAEFVPERTLPEEPDEPFPEDEAGRGWSHDSPEGWDEPATRAPDEAEASPAAESQPPRAGRTPPPAPAEPPPGPPEHPGQETVEYDVEGEDRRERTEEDVLEETPEFLQDTPDHDRLWFEQKPPRDFDFDK